MSIDRISDDLPDLPDPLVNYVGPFEFHDVVVSGHAVPFVTATPKRDGGVALHLDRRFGIDLSWDEAQRFVPFLADAHPNHHPVGQRFGCSISS